MNCYWLNTPPVTGTTAIPEAGGIAIVGSGLTGVSTAYWLLREGFKDITMVDFEPHKAASFRNCGHILHGTVESMKALVAIHGEDTAREIWGFSVAICNEVRTTCQELNIDCDYRQDGYLVIAIDDIEAMEINASVDLLRSMGFESELVSEAALQKLGFRHVKGGRYEKGSAQAHPGKFRNALLKYCLERGVKYHSGIEVTDVVSEGGYVTLQLASAERIRFDAAVIAANAYSSLLSSFYERHKLIEPFRGQIITSSVLPAHTIPVSYPHSFDHGYEYALKTNDNRLMIGGWRNHTEGGEKGTYDLEPNPFVEEGLKQFAAHHYHLPDDTVWEYSWSGIMAASKTGFPFIGPTDSPLIFTCGGYTGHGFSWAHGSAKLLAKIIAGSGSIPPVSRYFRPH